MLWCGRGRLRSEGDSSLFDEEFKILVLGARDVGKTAICQVYVAGRETGNKLVKHQKSELSTWDTVDGVACCLRLYELRLPSQVSPQVECDDPIIRSLIQRADGVLMVYAISSPPSFTATAGYHQLLLEVRGQVETPLVLLANKMDCTHEVTGVKGRETAFDLGASFYETSARAEPERVQLVFHDVIRQVRSVREHARQHPCTLVRGLIQRLSLKARRSKSRSRLKLTDQGQG
ncbi:ras-like protein family member 11B [Physella acuta]|uniref:ras-like protein family member 11B n=1 Tax=Physella acuta TaxID=109671 RepID=UPI0027DC87E7|nr:ras-like protein family member 11B [Physella acuta]XP_059156389.1 ras-like protein family member 11B [Physella acuta]